MGRGDELGGEKPPLNLFVEETGWPHSEAKVRWIARESKVFPLLARHLLYKGNCLKIVVDRDSSTRFAYSSKETFFGPLP